MKSYELANLLAVIDTDVQGNVRAIPFSYGAFLLHHSGIWLWLNETKGLTNDEKKEVFTALGLPDVTTAATSIDDNTVWGIGPDTPLMPMPFTLAQLNEFDKVSRGTITESIKPLNDEDFSATLIGVNASEVVRFLLFSEMPTDKAVPAQSTAPVSVPVLAGAAPAIQVNSMKKAALIAELEYEWPSIDADISDATRNGLKAAAHTGKHGEWDKDNARIWAASKGKIKQSAPVHSLTGAWPGTTTRHTISD